MNKRDRQTLARLGGFTFLIVIFLIRPKFNNPYVFLGLLIFGTAFVIALIESLIPVKSSTRKRHSPQKKYQSPSKAPKRQLESTASVRITLFCKRHLSIYQGWNSNNLCICT
ncbi:hypothetical protein BJQ97_01029 [Geobacillus sp. TFV-3]|nr:hypothetical protein BJQ97_01029 [Geobacillus sp. TFV-3]